MVVPSELFGGALASVTVAAWAARHSVLRVRRRYERALQEARHEAEHDGLTGALTRSAFARELEARLAQGGAARQHALLAIDVDGFGQINKLRGHDVGDALLCRLVETTADVIRDVDAIGRLGGDEFAVVLEGRDPVAVGERILATLRVPAGDLGPLEVSIGIARAPSDGTSVPALLRAADGAMRRAKRGGKGRIVAYAGESLADSEEARARRVIADVVKHRRIAMATQPIVDLRSGTIHAYETLARFGVPGDLSTGELFALAERVDMREELDLACFEQGLKLLSQRPAGTHLTVNVSSGLLSNPRALALLAAQRDVHGLVLEVTEEALVRDYAELQSAVQPLLERGVRIAVDDMGAGYSGLRHAIDLHPTYLKLDRALVQGIDRDPKRAALVDALLRYAQHAGSHILAEGVETEGELVTLVRLGVPFAQGYLLARPAPPWRTDIPASVRRHATGAALVRSELPLSSDVSTLRPDVTAEEAHRRFAADPALDSFVVLDASRRVLALLTRHRLLTKLGHRFGFALYGQRSVLKLADRQCLLLPQSTPWTELASRAMARPSETRHDPIVLLDVDGRFVRHLTIRDLLDSAEQPSAELSAHEPVR
ncbi:MAG TPA: EAL domain-containing protein [Conexibacter sp.]|nr:EAL domain-containing protein [Conexibacter sp.]